MGIFGKPWAYGVLLILVFAILGELLMLFDDYVFHRIGVSRDLVLTVVWLLPAAATYVATRYSPTHKLAAGLSFLVIFPLTGAAMHYGIGALGGTVDFPGLSGAKVVFGLYFTIGSVLIVAGTFLGVWLSRPKDPTKP